MFVFILQSGGGIVCFGLIRVFLFLFQNTDSYMCVCVRAGRSWRRLRGRSRERKEKHG